MLFAGGCSKEEAKKKAEDLKLEDLTIVLHDENITIYQPLGDLLDIWELDQAPEHIEALGHDMVFLTYKDNDRESMILRVFNPKDEEISVNDALIQRVVFSDRNTENVKEYKLPHNFKIGSTTEQDVIKALGTPYEYRISNDDSNMDYVTGTSYETSELAEFSFEKGKLSKVALSGSEKRKEKKENISFDTAKAVEMCIRDRDKVIMKQVLQDSGLSVVPWFFWTLHQPMEQSFFKKAQRLGYPLIIKPANLGSSVGIAVAHNDVELHKSMIEAFQYDHKVVIEKVIEPLREINASVLGDEDGCRCSTLEEVVKQDEILSYDNKYSGQGKSKGMLSTSRKLPAELSDEQAEEVRTMAMDAFRALNAAGVVRIDFLMHADSSALYVNEINTIPGSLSFYLWEKEGLSFPALLDELISLALQRVRREQKMIFSYDTNILRDYKGIGKLMK